MGMYTEIVFGAKIKPDEKVIEVLNYLVYSKIEDPDPNFGIDHPFFKTDRWDMVLRGASCYFPGKTHWYIGKDYFGRFDLTFRANIKNYDDEYEKFLDWLNPYIETEHKLLGYLRYEEDDFPTLIYKVGGKILLLETRSDIDIWEDT